MSNGDIKKIGCTRKKKDDKEDEKSIRMQNKKEQCCGSRSVNFWTLGSGTFYYQAKK
jgi:hypothetical protein